MKIISQITLNEKDYKVIEYTKSESARQDFRLCYRILNLLDKTIKNNVKQLHEHQIKQNHKDLQLTVQSYYIAFITTYTKTFTTRKGCTRLEDKDAISIINNKALFDVHKYIQTLRHEYISHGGPTHAEKYELYSVVGQKSSAEYTVGIVPRGNRLYLATEQEIQNFKKLSLIFVRHFTKKANKSMDHIRDKTIPVHMAFLGLNLVSISRKYRVKVDPTGQIKQVFRDALRRIKY